MHMAISGHVPVGFPAIAYCPRLPFRYVQLNEALRSLSGLLPLFPDIASEPSSQPFIPPLHCFLHTRNPEVTKPAPDVDLYILHHHSDISALTAGSQFFQFCLGFLQIPPHGEHPCIWLSLPATGRLRDFHPIERALTGHTTRASLASIKTLPGLPFIHEAPHYRNTTLFSISHGYSVGDRPDVAVSVQYTSGATDFCA